MTSENQDTHSPSLPALAEIIEALLLAAGQPVDIKLLQQCVSESEDHEVSRDDIKAAIEEFTKRTCPACD